MSLTIEVNGSNVDLENEQRVGLTFQVNNLGDLQSRQSNFSNQFKLPKTGKNTLIFENAANLNSSTVLPYKLIPAKVIQDGLEIVSQGFALMQNADDFYNVQIISGNKNFFSLIQDLYLNSIDMSAYDHSFGGYSVIDLRGNTDGWVYALIEWAKVGAFQSNANAVNIGKLQAVLFVHTIIEKMCAAVGYSVAGNFVGTTEWNNLLITSNFIHGKKWYDLQYYKAQTQYDQYIDVNNVSAPNTIYGLNTIDYLIIGNPANFTPNIYTTSQPMHGKIIAKGVFYTSDGITIHGLPTNYFGTLRFEIYRTGAGVVAYGEITRTDVFPIGTYTIPWEVEFEDDMFAGDQFQLRIDMSTTGPGGTFNANCDFYIKAGVTFEFIPSEQILFDSDVDVTDIMPPMKSGDFLKGIMNAYAITPTIDEANKILYLNKISLITDNLANAKDWSRKVDISKQPNINYRLSSYAQNNRFLYSNNDDCPDEMIDGKLTPFASGIMVINDEILELNLDVVTMPFAASKSVLRFNNVETPRIPFLNTDMTLSSFTTRLLMLDRQDIVLPLSFSGYSHDTDIPFCYFIKTGKANNLSFSDSLIKINYATIEAMFTQYKKVTCFVKLTAMDILNLDFMTPIYLEINTPKAQIQGQFYLNIVSNYKQNESTKIELIRI